MALRILYFAALRETLGTDGETYEWPEAGLTLGQLRAALASRPEPWPALAAMKNLKAAVNQTMAGPDAALADGDEVAFFPPVTGG